MQTLTKIFIPVALPSHRSDHLLLHGKLGPVPLPARIHDLTHQLVLPVSIMPRDRANVQLGARMPGALLGAAPRSSSTPS
jgi:hypothetical protein